MNSLRADIVLITPPFSLKENFGSLDFVGQYGLPMNLLHLASSLEKAGIRCKVADLSCETKSLEECARDIVSFRPDFVGIAVHFTFLANKALRLASLIKGLKPEIKIVAGGVHFTALPEETMRDCPSIDVGILGEAEVSLVEVVKSLKSGGSLNNVKGIIFRDEGGLFKSKKRGFIEDVNVLPSPRFDMIDISPYSFALHKEQRKVNLPVVTSRTALSAAVFATGLSLARG